jgi:hypothetical protein
MQECQVAGRRSRAVGREEDKDKGHVSGEGGGETLRPSCVTHAAHEAWERVEPCATGEVCERLEAAHTRRGVRSPSPDQRRARGRGPRGADRDTPVALPCDAPVAAPCDVPRVRRARRGRARGAACEEPRAVVLTLEQQELVARHIRLVYVHLNRRVPTPDSPHREREYDDLFQEGCYGLMQAAVRYGQVQPAMSFAAYAIPRIRRAVHAAIFEAFTTVRLPRGSGERRPALAMQGSDVLDKIEALGGCKRLNGAPASSETRSASMGPSWTAECENGRAAGERSGTAGAEECGPGDRELCGLGCGEACGATGEEVCGAISEAFSHAVRRRFEAVVADTLIDLRERRWRGRNPTAIMARMAYERLLIPEENGRTALRQIAREAGVSSGRAAAYERKLLAAVGEGLRNDAELRDLLRSRSARGRICVHPAL